MPRQLHVKEVQAIRDKAKALADANGDGVLDAAEAATASEWEGRLTSEALRTVDAYWNDKLAADGEAARVLAGMAAANSDFNVTEGGRAVAFLQQDEFYRNRVLYAAYIRENADLYDKALADWTPGSRQALQGKIKPSSLALIESVAAGAMGNATGDYVKRDADGKPLQGTIFDTLADVKAAQRELIAAERQLKEELAKPGLSDGARQETENQLKQVRYEMGTANTASNLVLANYDRMVLDGKLEGLGTFAKDTAIGLLELNADIAMAKYSPEARARLQDRAAALLTVIAAPTEVIWNLQRTYEYADVLEQRGEIAAAAALRTETDLALASTLSGVGGAARGAAVGIEKLAGTTGKLVAKAEALVAKGAEKTADLFDPKSGQVSSGHGAASAAADAEAGMPSPSLKLGQPQGKFDLMNPGPLPDNLAGTFSGGRYTEIILKEDTILYRAGTAERPLGEFFSQDMPNGVLQSRIDKAILPKWPDGGTSPIDSAISVRIPAGTKVYIGEVGSQGGIYVGGTQQIVIPKAWQIEGVTVTSIKAIK